MPSVAELLEAGYFPRELPPPFGTRAFAKFVVANLQNLPPEYQAGGRRSGRLSPHNLAQAGSLRRRLGLPNPVTQTRLVRLMVGNYPTLDGHIRGSQLSKSIPAAVPSSGRALYPEHQHAELPAIRASTRSARRYVVRADLIRFYPSLYTHSIPWALHTKPVAKTNRGPALLGNQLDRALRDGQDGQTIGMPVGPDTSLVIAETILASVDTALLQRLPRLVGHRYMDDYEIATGSRSEAEEALGYLQEYLGEYEFALNPKKTLIMDLPQLLEAPWAAELRNFSIRSTPVGQASDLIRFADRAYALAKSFPDDSTLAYSLARLRGIPLVPANWQLLEDILLQAMSTEPRVLPLALDWLSTASQGGWPIDNARVEEALSAVILANAPAGHGNEVAWALWACLLLGLQIHRDAAAALSRMSDSVVALLALDLDARRPLPGLDKSYWTQFMTGDDLWGEQWLLSYEANVHGWLPSLGVADHVAAEPQFAVLKAAGIEFYDSTGALPAVTAWTWTPPTGYGAPAGYAAEPPLI